MKKGERGRLTGMAPGGSSSRTKQERKREIVWAREKETERERERVGRDSDVMAATGNSRDYRPPRRKDSRHRRKSSNLLFSVRREEEGQEEKWEKVRKSEAFFNPPLILYDPLSFLPGVQVEPSSSFLQAGRYNVSSILEWTEGAQQPTTPKRRKR